MNILIFGGNRYFGKEIVKNLVKKNNKIYLVNRGNLQNLEDKKIYHIKTDRKNLHKVINQINNIYFDVVLDNSSYNILSVKKVFRLLGKNIGHYIYLSTILSYLGLSYKNFVDERSWFKIKSSKNLKKNYNEGIIKYGYKKEKAEKFIIKQKKINYTILRPHTVIGENDFSLRTKKLVFYNYNKLIKDRKEFIQFCFKDDLIKIILKLIYKPNKKSSIFNVCNNAIKIEDISNFFKRRKKKKNEFPLPINALMSNKKVKKELRFNFQDPINVLKIINKIF